MGRTNTAWATARRGVSVLASCLTAILVVSSSMPIAHADEDLFRQKIVPVFARRCLTCHDRIQRKGDLSLETGEDLLALGYVDAGHPDASYLLELVTPHDGRAEMPKNSDPLQDEEIRAIRDWIASGAIWPAGVNVKPLLVTDTDWWSLRPLKRPAVPSTTVRIRNTDGSLVELSETDCNSIDLFIARKHQELGLSFAAEASRETLIRRLYFDLIGLPPTSGRDKPLRT